MHPYSVALEKHIHSCKPVNAMRPRAGISKLRISSCQLEACSSSVTLAFPRCCPALITLLQLPLALLSTCPQKSARTKSMMPRYSSCTLLSMTPPFKASLDKSAVHEATCRSNHMACSQSPATTACNWLLNVQSVHAARAIGQATNSGHAKARQSLSNASLSPCRHPQCTLLISRSKVKFGSC